MTVSTMQRRPMSTAMDVSNEIDRISAMADEVGDKLDAADEAATVARNEYDYAYSCAFVSAEGSMDLRKHRALIATHPLRVQADTADLIVRQLKRRVERISRITFDGARTKSASHRAETSSFGPGSQR